MKPTRDSNKTVDRRNIAATIFYRVLPKLRFALQPMHSQWEVSVKPIIRLCAPAILAATLLCLPPPAFATQQGNDTNTWIKFCTASPKCHWRIWPNGDSIDIIWGGTVIICPMPPGPCTPMRRAPRKNDVGFSGNNQGHNTEPRGDNNFGAQAGGNGEGKIR
jgi:hypothetical protein